VAEGAVSLLGAARRRLLLWDISPAQVRELERTGKTQKTLTLHSPFNGFVVEKMAVEGMKTDAGMALYRLADLSEVWALADVYEYELPLVRVGQEAVLTLSYLPGEAFRGRVIYVYPYLDEPTRTAKVRIKLVNPGFRLKPGMFGNMVLRVPVGRVLAVPEGAILDTGTRKVAFVDRGRGYLEPREVRTGPLAQGYYQVTAGLRPGERVVASANFLIASESQLKAAMGAMGHAGH
jgi:Cu(I)/Ag(I) efflux system membrane fusion protein